MKTIAAEMELNDLEQLKLSISYAHETINLEQIQKAVDDFPLKIRAFGYCRGMYFKRTLKHLKLEWSDQNLVIFNSCNEVRFI